MSLLARIVLACVVGAAAFLVCVLAGSLLTAVTIPFVVTVGNFLKTYAGLIAFLVAVWWFFAGGSWWQGRRP